MRVHPSLDLNPLLTKEFFFSGDHIFARIPCWPLLPSTKVRPFQQPRLESADVTCSEMHGLEDGSIPATFQIMHMVRTKGLICVRPSLTTMTF